MESFVVARTNEMTRRMTSARRTAIQVKSQLGVDKRKAAQHHLETSTPVDASQRYAQALISSDGLAYTQAMEPSEIVARSTDAAEQGTPDRGAQVQDYSSRDLPDLSRLSNLPR